MDGNKGYLSAYCHQFRRYDFLPAVQAQILYFRFGSIVTVQNQHLERPLTVRTRSRLRVHERPFVRALLPFSYCEYFQQLNVRDRAVFCRSMADRLCPRSRNSGHSDESK